MVLAEIDESHWGTYDFFYLPIDFKNRCNVGYAFINMIDFRDIVTLHQRFNTRKWNRFNSEKVRRGSNRSSWGRLPTAANTHTHTHTHPFLFVWLVSFRNAPSPTPASKPSNP